MYSLVKRIVETSQIIHASNTAAARLDAAEASLRETIAALDTGLRVHVQEAVAQTQLALRSLGEKVHLLDTVRGLSSDEPRSPPGFVPAEARTAVEAADTRRRPFELELKLLTVETTATEQKVERYATERDLCISMRRPGQV